MSYELNIKVIEKAYQITSMKYTKKQHIWNRD